jgi:hypothetical protein
VQNGQNLAQEIHNTASLRRVPIIVMTAFGMEGLPSVVGCIRGLRQKAVKLLAGIGFQAGEGDVIETRNGYRLRNWIEVSDGAVVALRPDSGAATKLSRDLAPESVDDSEICRRRWIVEQIEAGRQLRAPIVARELSCSLATAKRDLEALKGEGKIEFVGASRTGTYLLSEAVA